MSLSFKQCFVFEKLCPQLTLYRFCSSSECDVLAGECIQTYVPYLFLVIPLGPVTLTGQVNISHLTSPGRITVIAVTEEFPELAGGFLNIRQCSSL